MLYSTVYVHACIHGGGKPLPMEGENPYPSCRCNAGTDLTRILLQCTALRVCTSRGVEKVSDKCDV